MNPYKFIRNKARRLPLFALSLLISLLGAAPLHADAYSDGRLAFARGDFDSAMRLLEQSTRSSPNNGNAYFYIGLIHERKGRKPQAIQAYKQGVARSMDADLREKALWKIVLYSKYVGDWGAVSAYSSQFLKYKHHPEMARLQAMAANQGGSASAELMRLVQKGQKAEKEGKLSEAIGYYEEALDVNPDAESVRWNLASLAMKANQYSRAVKHLQYLERRDSQWKYNYKLGVCYYQLGKYQSALSAFDRAEAQNKSPSSSFQYFLHIGRGLTYLELEDLLRAKTHLDAASTRKDTALLNGALARLNLLQGKEGDARKRMSAALKEDPNQVDALSVASLLSSDPDRYEKYLDSLYKNTVYQPPYYNAVVFQYVHVLTARSKYDRARTVLESLDETEMQAIEALKFNPADSSHRALILPGSEAELKVTAGLSRSEVMQEEISIFLRFDSSERGQKAAQAYNAAAAEKASAAAQGLPSEQKPQAPIALLPTELLRKDPATFEYVARLDLLERLLSRGDEKRALTLSRFWAKRSPDFSRDAMSLPAVKDRITTSPEWAAAFGLPSPDAKPDDGTNPNSADPTLPGPEDSNTAP
ncbi:MAG: tetratricopeptide repeat protein [Leptospiraceae bacterium]|nr:tetratricopeptide repeat protein [Leptospiraceae bacterium]